MNFLEGEHYWLKTKEHGWQIGRAYCYMRPDGHKGVFFEKMGEFDDNWYFHDFTDVIHIPNPSTLVAEPSNPLPVSIPPREP